MPGKFSALWMLMAASVSGAPRMLEVSVNGPVTPVTVEVVRHGLEQARREGAEAVILRLDTPGGLMDSMRECVEAIVGSKVPVITWVGPSGARAASAGFFLLEAGDVAAMAAATNTGAAHPVNTNGKAMDPVMGKKVENDAMASLRSLTAHRGRNSELAQQAVKDSRSFTEREAREAHLIEFVASSEKELLETLNGRSIQRFDGRMQVLRLAGAEVAQYRETVREQMLSRLSDPNVALLLLILGALGIYVEFHAPGTVLPGVVGAICVVLALTALSVLPISGVGATLMVLAFLFFGLELKFASHGVLGLGGVVALTLGALFLVDSPLPELRVGVWTALGVALPFGLVTAFLMQIAGLARANKAVVGSEAMVGRLGTMVEAGRVLVGGEYWSADSAGPVAVGQMVRVVGLKDLVLRVEAELI